VDLLPARLAAHAASARPAIVEPERSATYADLWQAARRFAALLRARGIGHGERVALLLGNSIEAAAATYGCWLAGAAVVPLNVQARARDFSHWLQHAAPALLVHAAGNAEVDAAIAMLAHPPLRLAVGADPTGIESWDVALAAAHVEGAPEYPLPEALATILYTSGTTGNPKGVMLSHANLAANVGAILEYLQLGAADSIVSVLPFYYSYGASVLHTHLAVGARLCLEPNVVFPQVLLARLARERASGFSGVPSTYALLLDRVRLADHDLSALRYLTQAGGAMAPALTARLLAALPQARLFVMYGQTEATARLTWLAPERLQDKLGSVGVPVAGVRIEVRCEDGSRAAADEVGEVWARGANVMLGYWHNAQATAEVLQDGWLKTGDLGRLDADGVLWLSGRRSDMIKTGAHRVHPLDVEEAIAELPGVVEVAVVGIDDALLGQVIKACIVRADTLDENAVRAHCRARLAGYKIPKLVEFVDALPKTASGKIKRAELAAAAASKGAS
jgi:acyl-CoA synthetase (AMP-forming)/AMP-acid ligase II